MKRPSLIQEYRNERARLDFILERYFRERRSEHFFVMDSGFPPSRLNLYGHKLIRRARLDQFLHCVKHAFHNRFLREPRWLIETLVPKALPYRSFEALR